MSDDHQKICQCENQAVKLGSENFAAHFRILTREILTDSTIVYTCEMNSRLSDKSESAATAAKKEITVAARAVSRGFAVGKVICLHGRQRQFYKINLDESQIESEMRRFRRAAKSAGRQLKKFTAAAADRTQAGIFEAHLLIIEDRTLLDKISTAIRERQINAEWAVKIVVDEHVAQFKKIADEYLRERYIDLEDVAERLLNALGGGEKSHLSLEKNSIIVAEELLPSTLIELSASQPSAIITENGGWTSHTFILAREMNLPALTGLKRIMRRVKNGDEVIVDGFAGQIIIHPQAETSRRYLSKVTQLHREQNDSDETVKGSLKTLDGSEIKLLANLDLPKGYAAARRAGAQGIGLYRSEFLFNQFQGFPGEIEQIEAYRQIARSAGRDGVGIRTFDLSVAQLADESAKRETNPALGLRAVRLSFEHLKEFRTQIRAILQASADAEIKIIVPMITDVAQIRQVREIIVHEKKRLASRKINYGNPPLGVMIEVPAAVLTIDEIVAEVEFICLGTNDLVQYLLAVDRDNEAVADWFRTLHPAVLRALKTVLQAAERRRIPALVCGEMAGSPVYIPILLGLGARSLSMNALSMPRVRRIVSQIAVEETHELIKSLETCRSADEVEFKVGEFYRANWSHLFPADAFPSNPTTRK